jgi:hypothetical protein
MVAGLILLMAHRVFSKVATLAPLADVEEDAELATTQ